MSESNSGKFKPYSNRLNSKNKSLSNNIFLDKFFLKEKQLDQQELRKQYFENLYENLERNSQAIILQQQRSPNCGRSKKKFFQQNEMYTDQVSTQQELSFGLEEQFYKNELRFRQINHQKGNSQQHQKIPSIKLDQSNTNINRKFRTSGSNLQQNDQETHNKIKKLSIFHKTVQIQIISDNKREELQLSQTQEISQFKNEQNEFTNLYNALLIQLAEQQNVAQNYRYKFNDLEQKFMKLSEEKKRKEKAHNSQQLELMKNFNANLEINQKQIGDLKIQTENYKKENNLLKEEVSRLLNLQEEQNQSIQEIQQLKQELQFTKNQQQQLLQQQQQQLQELNSKHIEDLSIQTEKLKLENNLIKEENQKRLLSLQEEYTKNFNQLTYQIEQLKQELQQSKDQLLQEQLKFQQLNQEQLQEIQIKDELCNSLKFKLNSQDLNIQTLKDQLSQYLVNQNQQENRLYIEHSKLIEQNQNVINTLQAEKTQLQNDLIICQNQRQESDNQIQYQNNVLQDYISKNEELQNKVKNYEIYFFDIQIKVITSSHQDGIKITVKQGSTLQDLFNYVSFKCYHNHSYELTSINIIEKRCNYRSNQWNKRLFDIFSGEELLKCQMIEFQKV